jgi:kojibiose phosphorylase
MAAPYGTSGLPPSARSTHALRAPTATVIPAPELDHPFRLIAFDWDGTAVPSRTADATRVVRLMDAVLALGARLAIVTGTHFGNVKNQLGSGIAPQNARRLYVSTNRGSEIYGFDRRGEPVALWRRTATPEEDDKLTAVAEEVRDRLVRLTGLSIEVVKNRLNRRKIDLIPEPQWADPPKSAIGELLAATEARLRGAGLRHGLREAFEMTECVARELGLADARVTSDVKHIEVGLTDKSDAMAYLFRELARPLAIASGDVLLVGDEFGPIGGFEGSDHKMLGVAEATGVMIASVGPEPGGAPERVVHLGGGPERFCELLEQQLAVDKRLGPFAAPRDAAWAVEESGFDLAREHEIESLMAIANGYLGSRGSIAEGSSVSRPATFLAGAFEPSNDVSRVPELVILPEWGRLRFAIDGEPMRIEQGEVLRHRRTLDLRRGLLLRESQTRAPAGHVTTLRTVHVASLAEPHLLLEGVELTAQNYTGLVSVEALLSGEVKSGSGAAHWNGFETSASERGVALCGKTHAGLTAALTSAIRVRTPDNAVHKLERSTGSRCAAERAELAVRLDEPVRLYRNVTIYTSRDLPDPLQAATALAAQAAPRSTEALLGDHERAWAARWRLADVTIEGAPSIERALRFALYHLMAAANPRDPRCSIGARALSGEAYRGHVFWDTEIFMTPFFWFSWPEAARAQLVYRHHTLDAARRKARAGGWNGALYAWESADTGDECTPSFVLSPFGQVVRVLSGEQEQHISADVAWAVDEYVRATGDVEFAATMGLEILVETARFWASRVVFHGDGMAHIEGVIGPDEYHEGIDDNAFTNWMARHNLLVAAAAVQRLGSEPAAAEVLARIGFEADERARWRDVAARMYLGLDPQSGLVEQFDGFHRLEPIDLRAFEPRNAPMDVLLGRERTQRSQVVKQADVVQLSALLWDELSPAVRMANFLYYEPRTGHGSSLSPGIHALVAARLGLLDVAARYLEMTAAIDLGNNMGNSAGGVHAAGMGSFWQAVVFGVAGVRLARDAEDVLVIDPRLLSGWRHLAFPLLFRGAELEVHIEPRGLEIVSRGGNAARLRLPGAPGPREVRLEPGRAVSSALDGSKGGGR